MFFGDAAYNLEQITFNDTLRRNKNNKNEERTKNKEIVKNVKFARRMIKEFNENGIGDHIEMTDELRSIIENLEKYEQFRDKVNDIDYLLHGRLGAYDVKYKYNTNVKDLRKLFKEMHDKGLITLMEMSTTLNALDNAELEYKKLKSKLDENYKEIEEYYQYS